MTPADILKSLVWDNIIKIALTDLLVAWGLASGGLEATMVSYVFTLVANGIWKAVLMLLNIGTIKLLSDVHQKAFDDASEKLAIVEKEFGPQSQQYKDAHEKEKSAFYDRIAFKPNPLGDHT